jgi:hypothetical protein
MGLYIVERKTSGEDILPGSSYWQRLILDVQISTYIDAVETLGYKVDGVIYDLLGKPRLRPLQATPVEERKYTKPTKAEPTPRLYANQRYRDETAEEYGRRILEAMGEEPDRFYQRQKIVRLENERLEAQADIWQTAGAIRDARRLKVFPRNPDSCHQWGRPCEFFPICSGLTTADDEMMFKREERAHEELDSDAPRDGQALVLLTQSSLRAYRACPRRYYYRYEMRLRPLAPKDEKLRRGSSVHRALEVWSKTGGDVEAAIAALDRVNEYDFQYERAMVIGYHARWEKPAKTIAVEKEFRFSLINPETGAASRTFELGGRVDALEEHELD